MVKIVNFAMAVVRVIVNCLPSSLGMEMSVFGTPNVRVVDESVGFWLVVGTVVLGVVACLLP